MKSKRCHQCTTRRKGCDLERPRCGRCSRIGLKCSFASPTAREEQPHIGTVQTDTRRSIDSLGRRFDVNTVIHIARSLCDDLPYNLEPYLESFNKWLPVVDGPALKARSQARENLLQDEGCSTLLVACALLSRISGPNLAESDIQENHGLYITLVVSHATMSSRGSKSLEMLQSKILLAFYEHLQANHTTAVGTLSSAVEIAKALGIVRWHCLAEQRTISLGDEEQRTLCCLYILERLVHATYHDVDPGPITMSCPKPCPNTMLLDEQGGYLKLASDGCTNCDGAIYTGNAADIVEPLRPSLLGRLFQSAFLLDSVIEHVVNSRLRIDLDSQIPSLQKAISKLAVDIHEDRCRGVEMNCSVLGLCVSCILIMYNQRDSARCQPDEEYVNAALRMVFDRLSIVPAFQYKFARVISPWELHCFCLAAMKYRCLSAQPGEVVVENGTSACAVIEELLKDYSTGWRIAGEFLTKVQ